MALSKKAVEEFQQIFKQQYGEDLPDDIAAEAAERLIHFVGLVYKPIKKEDEAKFKESEAKFSQVSDGDKVDYVRHTVRDIIYSRMKRREDSKGVAK